MVKKKKFFDVEVPLLKTEVSLLADSLADLENRNIRLDLTRMLRGKSIEIKFKVVLNKEKNKAIAEPQELTLMPFYIRRMMRKKINYVEDSFSAECKNAILRIKPFLITRKKVTRKVRKALREKAREELIDYIKNKPHHELFTEIITNKLQKHLSLKLKKIYPLALCEIRIMKVEKLK